MAGTHDWEKILETVEQGLDERRKALKAELDAVWEKDAARSSDVLQRMQAAVSRSDLISGLKDKFLSVARASKSLEADIQEIQSGLETILTRIHAYRAQREAITDEEIDRLASLFSEELGRESLAIDFAWFSEEDIEALKRVLDRSKARMKAGVGMRPVDLGERVFEMRPAPADPESDPEPAAAQAEPQPQPEPEPEHEHQSDGLAEELEEETGILLADEVVDMEPTQISAPSARKTADKKIPALDEDDDVMFVDEKP